jgi:pyruvate carboxylase
MFFFGPDPDTEHLVEIEPGKTLIVRLLAVGEPHADGKRTVFFELNGQPREVLVLDQALVKEVQVHPKADPANPLHVGAPMPGLVVRVNVSAGESVEAGQKLLSLEAMKMETTVYADKPGKIAEALVRPGTQVEAGDLLLRFE